MIHPLINKGGIGILDGSREEMLAAITLAYQRGKGIYGMKPIGGGNLHAQAREALEYAFNLPVLHAVAVGMKSEQEVAVNVALVEGREPDARLLNALEKEKRSLHLDDWCQGCGQCVEACPQAALSLYTLAPSAATAIPDMGPNGLEDPLAKSTGRQKVRVDPNKCLLCGYCGASCPEFCIKII